MAWKDVTSRPDYISLPDSEKRIVADRYYKEVISARPDFVALPPEEQQVVKTRFGMESGYSPQAEEDKKSLLQKIGGFLTRNAKPEVERTPVFTSPPLEAVGKFALNNPVTKFALGGLISHDTASKFAEKVGKKFPESKTAQIGAAALGTIGEVVSPIDILLPLVSKLRLLSKAPAAVKAAEVASMEAQHGKAVVQEAMTLAEHESDQVIAALNKSKIARAANEAPKPLPKAWESTERIDLGRPPAAPKPFTMAGAIPEDQAAKLAALRQNLPAQALPVKPPVAAVAPAVAPAKAVAAAVPEVVLTPGQKLVGALKNATRLRGKQEGIYEAERARQTATLSGIEQSIPGQAGYEAQRAALRGPMEKVEFSSLLKDLDQPTVDGLFKQISDHPELSVWEKFNAKTGMQKLLGKGGGSVPIESELKLLKQVFGDELVAETLAKRSLMEKMWDVAGNYLNLPRAMMSTADLSMPFRQGAVLISRPKQFLPAFRDQFKYAWDEKAYEGLLANIKARPTYDLMKKSKLDITTLDTLGSREEQFATNLAEQIPIFGRMARGSNRAASGFLNQLRADVFDDLVAKATESGAIKEPGTLNNIADFINTATGRGSFKNVGVGKYNVGFVDRIGPQLNATFFSPKLMASRMSMLNPAYYVKLDPFTRKEALKSVFLSAATAATIAGLAKAAGADVGIDPRSADFLKVKVGNTRFDIGGGFNQYLVLAGRLMTNQMVNSATGKEFNLGEGYKATDRLDIANRFLGSKMSPVASFAKGLMTGKTMMGDDFDVPAEIADRFIPMVAQDILDLSREWGPKGLLGVVPGVFGVGSQTYSDKIPHREKSPTGKETIRWGQAPGLGSILTGSGKSNIPPEEIKRLQEEKKNKTAESMQMDIAKKQVAETGNPVQVGGKVVYFEQGEVKTKDLMPGMDEGGKAVIGGVMTELRSLGIPFEPNLEQAQYLLKEIIQNPEYKYGTREQKKVLFNQILMGGEAQGMQ